MTVRAEGSDGADVGALVRRPVQVRHLAGIPARQPVAKEPELGMIGGRRDPAEIEAQL